MNQLHLLPDRLQIPGLHRGNPDAPCFFDSRRGRHHHIAVHTVPGKRGNTVFRAGGHQNIIIGHIIQAIPIMKRNGSHRSCKNRITERFSKELQRSVHRLVFCDGIHLYTDLFPFVVVSYGSIPDPFGTGPRHLIFTGSSITLRTGLTEFADPVFCFYDTFGIIHFSSFLSCEFLSIIPIFSKQIKKWHHSILFH